MITDPMYMRSVVGILVVAVSIAGQGRSAGSSTPDGLDAALQAIRGESILQHVKTLASDNFEGRAPGTRGEKLTVDYITAAFKRAGLKPGNPNGSFVQKVPLVGYKTSAQIDLQSDGQAIPFDFLKDFVHDFPRLEPDVSIVPSGVVFAGYGIIAPQFGWDDYKNVDVRNKLVVVLTGEPNRPDKSDPKRADISFFKGDERTYYSTRDFKYELARKLGAAGLLVVTDPEKSRTFSIFKTFAGLEGMALVPNGRSGHSLAIAGLMTTQAAERICKAAGKSFKEMERQADSPDFRAAHLNLQGKITVKSSLRRVTSNNVVAKINGSDRALKNEYVIYSAHWDHLGIGTSLKGDQIYNGANDNAAGTSQLIEVGRAFAALKTKPKRSILFIATTAEEKGFLGARFYVQNPLYPIRNTVAAINLDAGNLFGLTKDLASTGYGNSTLDVALDTAAETQGRVFLKRSLDNGTTYFASDQIEFAKAGVPAIFPWSGGDYVGKSADFGDKIWDDFSAKRYHQVTDELISDWDTAGAVEDARWMMIAGFLVAEKTERPRWLEGSEFVWLGKDKQANNGVKKN